MRTMHLFAGVGGGLLADLILGHTPIIAVEWDKYCCQVLRERAADGWFPELSVWEGDVRLFDPSEYTGKVDCIHAGFPCQDISVAGNQAGLGEGTRSGLYREVLRIAGIVKPRQIFLENVSAILSNGLGTVLADLAAMGYDTRWICLRASEVGAPHHRDRWWGLCTNTDSKNGGASCLGQDSGSDGWHESGRMGESLSCIGQCGWVFETERLKRFGCPLCGKCQTRDVCNPEHSRRDATEVTGSIAQGSDSNEARTEQAVEPTRPGNADLANTNSAQRERTECAKRSESEHSDISGSSWWDIESLVGRVAGRSAYRVERLKGLGNIQVPMQAAVAYSILNQRND